MRRLPVDALHPGMKVGHTIFSSEGVVLVKAGWPLSNKIINRLRFLGIPSVYIDDGFIDDIEILDVIKDSTRADAVNRVRNIFRETNVGEKGLRLNVVFNEQKVVETVERLLEDLLLRKDVIVSLADIRSFDDYTYAHSVNVSILALMTGRAMKLSQKALLQLGVGAILHDLGKVMIPMHILNKPDQLTKEEFQVIKRHPKDGYNIVRAKDRVSKLTASVIYEHHERHNGSGYPRMLKDSEIHIYGQIVGLADVYDALTADRIYRKAYLPHQVYEMLAGAGGSQFNYEVIKVFLENIAIYPLGTYVELSTGQIGVVVGFTKGLTHRPTVRIFLEEKDAIVPKLYEVDLSTELYIVINRVLSHVDIENLKSKVKEAKIQPS